jgi:hypothetical protein
MRGWGEQALAAAQDLSDPPLTAASTAVLAVAAAFLGAVADAKSRSTEAAALVDTLADDELGLRLDALANLATAELYLHRYEHAGEHAQRGLVIARATGQGDQHLPQARRLLAPRRRPRDGAPAPRRRTHRRYRRAGDSVLNEPPTTTAPGAFE